MIIHNGSNHSICLSLGRFTEEAELQLLIQPGKQTEINSDYAVIEIAEAKENEQRI